MFGHLSVAESVRDMDTLFNKNSLMLVFTPQLVGYGILPMQNNTQRRSFKNNISKVYDCMLYKNQNISLRIVTG